jgi:hypothetical protein
MKGPRAESPDDWNGIASDPTLVAQILRISSADLPPPGRGFHQPLWCGGSEKNVVERFGGCVPEAKIPFEQIPGSLFSRPFLRGPLVEVSRYRDPARSAFEAAAGHGPEGPRAERDDLFQA